MITVLKDGKPVSRSKNLAGQLAYARKSPPVRVVIRESDGMSCDVATEFADGATVDCHWASFDVAVDFYRRRARHSASQFHGLILEAWPMRDGKRVIAFLAN